MSFISFSGRWFLFSFTGLYSSCVYSMSSLLLCHSSLGVSQHCDNEFIWKYTLWAASACGRVHGDVCTYVHICTVCVHVNITMAHYAVCVCVFWYVRAPQCVCKNSGYVNMSGCRRRPISWCISEEVSIHTPVCGPITPTHHILT